MRYFQCGRCMKKFQDDRGEEMRFACPFCHAAVFPLGRRPSGRISGARLMIIRGTHVYRDVSEFRGVMGSGTLRQCRTDLEFILYRPDAGRFLASNWRSAGRVIARWFRKYKEWEAADTFERAFRDGRMVIRYGKRAIDEVLNPLKASRTWGGPKTDFEFPLAVGMVGVLQRMNPDNFENKHKVELGLHDLSASLLSPKLTITQQTFGFPTAGQKFVFMPLSDPRDQQLFSKLSMVAKMCRDVHPELYGMMTFIRARMTRIKLANDYDMGTNFVAERPDSDVNPKFKYMPSKQLKVRGGLPRTIDEGDVNDLKRKALHFKTSGLGPPEEHGGRWVNEITVAFRQHAGYFPIFAEWDGERLREFRLNEGGEIAYTGAYIHDDGTVHMGS